MRAMQKVQWSQLRGQTPLKIVDLTSSEPLMAQLHHLNPPMMPLPEGGPMLEHCLIVTLQNALSMVLKSRAVARARATSAITTSAVRARVSHVQILEL
jgi:hypothetical protein